MSEKTTRNQNMHQPEYNDRLIYHYLFSEKDTHEVPFEGISCIFVEIEKFTKTEEECITLLDQWFYLIKNSYFLLDKPSGFREKVFDKFFRLLEISKFTPMENRAYLEECIDELDRISILRTAENRGKEQEQLRIAKELKSKNISIDIIAQCTGLSTEQIEKL